uniref:Uncharacterized protein n=1 Tax=Nelumbo nucifera TaxID=4432 RepID=A0A822XP00_NELNU|nr:TPA_asm: hypothetical protein HUJ06_022252 [Nelumbo nucifera]
MEQLHNLDLSYGATSPKGFSIQAILPFMELTVRGNDTQFERGANRGSLPDTLAFCIFIKIRRSED